MLNYKSNFSDKDLFYFTVYILHSMSYYLRWIIEIISFNHTLSFPVHGIIALLICRLITFNHPMWRKPLRFKLSIPNLLVFSMICVLGTILYTYCEFAAPSENDYYLAANNRLSSNDLSLSTFHETDIRGLITIGISLHSVRFFVVFSFLFFPIH